ncbi:hypothetical protein Mtc_0645 [Methanocella conradii HZ254]|uniref:Next to BRCA1 central domain-containing protein n=1 Tax=Methanocella conradii (strain DSM 24694 / JCM 17849 / CGMCC 1.5162 / HZ254) TaxID=1041930 RepID=H8I6T8_METCZ|nr:hypothetical protein [Methanocella conradii]AFC99408.1 hypothetical protein Mtc_0645 [Methanocella conradii HZ254]
MSGFRRKRAEDAVSELQDTLVLLAILIMAVLLIKNLVGDNLILSLLDFGKFKVWGADNEVSYPSDAPLVTIINPPDGSRFYADHYTSVSGSVQTIPNRHASQVYYRLNGGPWVRAALSDNNWTGEARRYPEGSYHVEAIAYDSTGMESPTASSAFETIWRPYPDAAYMGDDIPEVMTAGDPYSVHINYSNTGYLSWNSSGGYRLSPSGSTMSLPPIGLNTQVEPNISHVFSLSMVAPSPGDYTVGYRMWCADYEWFGEEFSKKVKVLESYHDARVVSMDMPAEMTVGETRLVSIVMQNMGSAAWFAEGNGTAYLWMVDGTSGAAYKFNGSSDRILMAPGSVVRSGNNYTFQFTIKAPSPGSYYTQYRMVWDGHYAFGQVAGCTINVKALPTPTPAPTQRPPASPTPTPEPQYNAHGKMTLLHINGFEYTGPIRYFYDGPLGKHFKKSSRGASSDNDPRWDWDIGGPNGHYRIYNDVDGYSGELQFEMNNGGNKGKVVFRQQ